ncbi:MAG: DUF4440 domain-containing protein [Bacteroidota bacterium]
MNVFYCILILLSVGDLFSQNLSSSERSPIPHKKEWVDLIDAYALAREAKDTILLKEILVEDIDQLVSSGVWRRGLKTAIQGMQQSSSRNPGKRTLTVEHVRLITPASGIVDARYEIQHTDGSIRKMWSTFIVILEGKKWKIAGIRNMLPAKRAN